MGSVAFLLRTSALSCLKSDSQSFPSYFLLSSSIFYISSCIEPKLYCTKSTECLCTHTHTHTHTRTTIVSFYCHLVTTQCGWIVYISSLFRENYSMGMYMSVLCSHAFLVFFTFVSAHDTFLMILNHHFGLTKNLPLGTSWPKTLESNGNEMLGWLGFMQAHDWLML